MENNFTYFTYINDNLKNFSTLSKKNTSLEKIFNFEKYNNNNIQYLIQPPDAHVREEVERKERRAHERRRYELDEQRRELEIQKMKLDEENRVQSLKPSNEIEKLKKELDELKSRKVQIVGPSENAGLEGQPNEAKIQDDHEQLIENTLCTICKDRKKNVLIEPCRHICVCEECNALVTTCPLCRVAKTSSKKVYL